MDNSDKIILKVEKSKVQEKRFNAYKMEHSGLLSPNDVSFWQGYKTAIDELFGDESLPDAVNPFGKNIVTTDNNTLTVNKENNKNKEINLCKILKGHEGESFYSPLYGNVKLVKIDAEQMPIEVKSVLGGYYHNFTAYGKYMEDDWGGECVLFPSKTQRDWNKWLDEQKHKIPKTWSDLERLDEITESGAEIVRTFNNRWWDSTKGKTPIEKSALALLKINQLIEVGYGGNVMSNEWDGSVHWVINCAKNNVFEITSTTDKQHISFHTREQALEFLEYYENIVLLKFYFMSYKI